MCAFGIVTLDSWGSLVPKTEGLGFILFFPKAMEKIRGVLVRDQNFIYSTWSSGSTNKYVRVKQG